MVETNEGSQTAIISQDARFDQKDLNLWLYQVIPGGVYNGFSASVKDTSTAEFTAGQMMIKDSGGDKEIQKISTSEKVKITADHTSPFFVARKDIKNKTDNYAEFTTTDSPNDTDVILASGTFNSNNDLDSLGTDVVAGERDEVDLLNGLTEALKSKVSANDDAGDFLEQKLEAGTAVSFSVQNEGGDEKLRINNQQTLASGTTVRISDNDNTGGFLEEKVSSDDEITLTVQDEGNDETLKIGINGKRLRVSSNDQNSDFLLNKLSEGAGVSLTEKNDGGDETLEVSATGAKGVGGANKFDGDVTIATGNSSGTFSASDHASVDDDATALLLFARAEAGNKGGGDRVQVKHPSDSNFHTLADVRSTSNDMSDNTVCWYPLDSNGELDFNLSDNGGGSTTKLSIYAELT